MRLLIDQINNEVIDIIGCIIYILTTESELGELTNKEKNRNKPYIYYISLKTNRHIIIYVLTIEGDRKQ
jgi:hypothetical protein